MIHLADAIFMSIKRDEKSEWNAVVNMRLKNAQSLIEDGRAAFAICDYKLANAQLAEACEDLEAAFNAISNLYAMSLAAQD